MFFQYIHIKLYTINQCFLFFACLTLQLLFVIDFLLSVTIVYRIGLYANSPMPQVLCELG